MANTTMVILNKIFSVGKDSITGMTASISLEFSNLGKNYGVGFKDRYNIKAISRTIKDMGKGLAGTHHNRSMLASGIMGKDRVMGHCMSFKGKSL